MERPPDLTAHDSHHLERSLAKHGDSALVKSARRFLRDEPDPLGAAMVSRVVSTGPTSRDWAMPEGQAVAWAAQHGLAFAVCATVEADALVVNPRTGLPEHPAVYPDFVPSHGNACLRSARTLLAVAADDEYRAAVERLEEHRTTYAHRLATAYLVPERHDWVEDCCTDPQYANRQWHRHLWRLRCALDTPDHADLFLTHIQEPWRHYEGDDVIATLVDGLGSAALPLLTAWLRYSDVESGRTLYKALALLPEDAAFDILAERAGDKHVQPILVGAMERFPVRALRLLGPRASGTSRTAQTVTDLLRGHVRAHPDLAASALPGLPEQARKVVGTLLDAVTAQVPDAPADALPRLLVEPPWKTRRKKAKPVVIPDLTVPDRRSITWAPGERERWLNQRTGLYRAAEPDDWTEAVEDFRRLAQVRQVNMLAFGPEEMVRPLLTGWTPDYEHPSLYPSWAAPQRILARFQLDAFELFLGIHRVNTYLCDQLIQPFLCAEAAGTVAYWLARVPRRRAAATAWLERHGLNAVPFLVPPALGKQGARRREAEAALRLLATTHGEEATAEAAAEHGQRAADAIASLLATDPLETFPARLPKLGAWADPRLLPQVLLRERGLALPADAVGHVLTMLSISTPDQVYPGVEIVREACDPESLARFSWEVFRRWDTHGVQPGDNWALHQLGRLGDDEAARRLAPLLRSWAAERRNARVAAGLDVLATIGSDVAMAHLNGIALSARSAPLRKKARERLEQVAADRGLSPEQLADRLAPTFGLEADGGMTLDYGPRRFRVGFDERLNPSVLDEDGKARTTLPRPSAADDSDLAPAAYQRFAALKKDVAKVAADHLRRLERAMADRRRWPVPEFRAFLVDHPLVWHIARRLIWTAETGGELTHFRIAEDRTFADVRDDALDLPDSAQVAVGHPVRLGDQLGAWAELFADYEILQPFPQLARPVHTLTKEEAAGDRLAQFEGLHAPAKRLLALRSGAWDAAELAYEGITEIARNVGGDRQVVITLNHGLRPDLVGQEDDREITRVSLIDRTDDTPVFADLPPETISEILLDLNNLTTP